MKFFLTCIFSFFFLGLTAQVDPVGKQFTAKIGEACKLMSDGGCTIYRFCSLIFQKDSVAVFYSTKASCVPKEREKNYERNSMADSKSYPWKKTGSKITIKGFDDYGILTISETSLIGKIEKNKVEPLVFEIKNPDQFL